MTLRYYGYCWRSWCYWSYCCCCDHAHHDVVGSGPWHELARSIMQALPMCRIACATVVHRTRTGTGCHHAFTWWCFLNCGIGSSAEPSNRHVTWLVGGTDSPCALRAFVGLARFSSSTWLLMPLLFLLLRIGCVQHTSHMRSTEVVCMQKIWKMSTLCVLGCCHSGAAWVCKACVSVPTMYGRCKLCVFGVLPFRGSLGMQGMWVCAYTAWGGWWSKHSWACLWGHFGSR